VQNATPDGYTLLVFSGSQHATVPAAGNAPYEPVKGFRQFTFLFNSVVVLTVPEDSPAKTMAELHDLGRKSWAGSIWNAGPRLAVASCSARKSCWPTRCRSRRCTIVAVRR